MAQERDRSWLSRKGTPSASTRTTSGSSIPPGDFLGTELREKAGLSIPFDVYFQDPSVAERDPDLDFDRECCVDWEPHLAAGPTSARFAVVDFNSDTSSLAPPAQWDESQLKFVHDGLILDREVKGKLQYHQVSVWAILQRALAFFEEPNGLGRRIPWGFDGNRLLVVPHAGYGKNAYYDRQSKSLQFYYFDKEGGGQVFTCLSTDIVHHEFGHAVLDGIAALPHRRPPRSKPRRSTKRSAI